MKNIKRVFVVGDLILDIYFNGEVKRISPEKPVPVLNLLATNINPGGAANVAMSIAEVDLEVNLLGVTGDDSESKSILESLSTKVNTDGILKSKVHSTISKIRVHSNQNHFIRIDKDTIYPNYDLSKIELNPSQDIVYISDYGKGTIGNSLVPNLRNKYHDLIIIVDPKDKDWKKYKGASYIKPNKSEFDEVLNFNSNSKSIPEILKEYEIKEGIIVTKGEEGARFYSNKKTLEYRPIKNIIPLEVSGAGDLFGALFVWCLNKNLSIDSTLKICVEICSKSVSKNGVCYLDSEILLELEKYEKDSLH